MKINVVIKNRSESYYANAVYQGNTIVVKAGGRIEKNFASHIQGGKRALKYRNDPAFVDDNGTILKDCTFTSPSTAAQFVSGTSKNGYVAWKLEDGSKLGDYLKEKGLR